MKKNNSTALAQIGLFPLGNVQSTTTPAINTTTFIVRSLSELSPINNSSLIKNCNKLFSKLYYGGIDTPTTRQLSQKIAKIEKGKFALLAPSGQSAIHLLITARTMPGDHVLICDTVTYSTQWLLDQHFAAIGIEVEYFEPSEASSLSSRLKPNTKIVFWESPGAFTYELVDGRAVVEACKDHSALTVLDNTWAASTFYHPLEAGVDATLISMTKSHAAVSGISLGAIVTNNRIFFESIKTVVALLGSHVSSETCANALYSMSTLSARLSLQMSTTRYIIEVLTGLSAIKRVLHPTVRNDQNNLFNRDYSGFNSLISIEFACHYEEVITRIDRLKVIKVGYGWGGTISLVSLFNPAEWRSAKRLDLRSSYARIYLGLEDVHDIEMDLRNAFGP